ncbi:MAG TPA: M20/M25/M40 family metallo-hydrolase [Pyrinomonadaceae bacterium]
MIRRQFAALVLLFALFAPYAALAQQQTAQPALDPNDPIARIRDEGMNRSQVMQTLSYLTDVIGPRLTASPQMKRANDWTRDTLAKWGLQNANVESWGTFGRGWSLKRFSAQVIEPQGFPLIAYPKAWSPGTNGPVAAEVVYFDAKDEADLARFKGKLKGKIVLTAPTREVKALFVAPGTRRDEKNLLALANAPMPRPGGGRGGAGNRNPQFLAAQRFAAAKNQFFVDEGAAVLVDPGRGDGGTIFVSAATVPQPFSPDAFGPAAANPNAPRRFRPWDKDAPKMVPQVAMAVEHYNRVVRMIQAGETVKIEVELAVEWQDKDLDGYNTIAEIPGSDPTLKDEIVMLGGHMDSWHGGTGATDNGAGVAVGMEAVRIIQALGLKPRRTIRIALWSGEEQGLLGSRAYVAKHFGRMEAPAATTAANGNGTSATPPAPVLVKLPDYDKVAGYFNLDNGTGKIRGVYLQGNEAMAGLFRQWLAPFRDLGAETLSLSNTGGTDHLAFDAVGLPGFQFIQDEIEYDTRTHHSNMDVFDRIQADDMKQASTIMAAFVYNAAMRDEKLPRKALPAR